MNFEEMIKKIEKARTILANVYWEIMKFDDECMLDYCEDYIDITIKDLKRRVLE